MVLPRTTVSPLDSKFPIVDLKYGTPSLQFLRLWQQMFGNEAGTYDITVTLQTSKADKSIQIIAGTGLTGGGDLSANRTLNIDTTAEAERIRDVIGATLVAGTNITITVNDGADTITIDASGGGGGGLAPCAVASGTYVWPETLTSSTGQTTLTQDTLYFLPLARDTVLSHISTEVITPVGGANMRFGLYTNGSNNKPDQLIEECTTQSVASGGVKDAAFLANQTLTDIVWMAFVTNGSGVQIARGTISHQATSFLGGNDITTAAANTYTHYSAPFTYAALPANTGSLTLSPIINSMLVVGKVA